jgi:Ca-activated chloride channel homolog
MFEFAHRGYLWFLLIIPVIIFLYMAAGHYRKSALRKFGDPGLLATLMPLVSSHRNVAKFSLFLFSLVFIILALAGPRFGSRLEEVQREGVEILIALDVSNSMLAEDIRPSRLEASKQSVSRLSARMRNDRIGMIVFAGDAFVQVPVTSDYAAFRMILENVSTDIVPVQGTAIGRAIELASRSFTQGTMASKVLIIISDGEDHEDDPVKVAGAARDNGITIHTIGMGRPEGAPVPVAGRQSQFLTDEDGNTVITRLDEATLRGIASAGGGLFVRAGSSGTGLDIIMDEIEKMEKAGFEEVQYTEFTERFQYMAFIALLLLLLDFIIAERRNKWLSSINLFKGKNNI